MRGAARLGRGDHLIFYISLKCWPELGGRRPASGLLIGSAVVLTDVRRMERPVLISGRRFLYSCELFFERLAELGSGVPIGPLKEELDLTAGKSNYGQALQRTPVLLSPARHRTTSSTAFARDQCVRGQCRHVFRQNTLTEPSGSAVGVPFRR